MKKTIMIALVALVAALAINTSTASAAVPESPQASVAALGQCGGRVHSWLGYYNNLKRRGALGDAKRVNRGAGYSPRDGSFKQWLRERVIVTRLTKSTTIGNYGCGPGGLGSAGSKHLSNGWPVLVALPDKYSKKDISTRNRKGYTQITISASLVGQASCTNPADAKKVKVRIWIKKEKLPPPPLKPPTTVPPPSGGCTVIINGDNNGNAGCGNIQICTANGSYNNNSTLCNIYMNCVAIQGYTWDSTQNVCIPPPPPPPPPCTQNCAPSVLITTVIDLNDVPAGLNSGPMPFTVYASAPGARVTIDPGIGKISTCNSNTPLATLTITGLQAGDNDLCVIFYAPTDAAATSATITYTATLTGATPAVRQVTFAITHPTRP